MKWLPIETAPKDGSLVDLWLSDPVHGYMLSECHWDKEYDCWRTIELEKVVDVISHWMPLPDPPGR